MGISFADSTWANSCHLNGWSKKALLMLPEGLWCFALICVASFGHSQDGLSLLSRQAGVFQLHCSNEVIPNA